MIFKYLWKSTDYLLGRLKHRNLWGIASNKVWKDSMARGSLALTYVPGSCQEYMILDYFVFKREK